LGRQVVLMKSKRPCLVVAGGDPPPADWLQAQLQGRPLVYAADSGLRILRACGHQPDLLVGDLDSLHRHEWADLEESRLRRYPTDKDQSDLELTLEHLAQVWQGRVDIVAALGGRLDHALFNLAAVLACGHRLGLELHLVDPGREVRWLQRSLTLQGYRGWTCSILPWGGDLIDVHLRGFRYPLQGERLPARSTRGLSNVVEEDCAEIDLGQGEGLLILQEFSDRVLP
jgi:thiamine pyrophosphokinase